MQEVRDQANLFHVGFYAADEERVGHAESGHESMEGVLGKKEKTKFKLVLLLQHLDKIAPSVILNSEPNHVVIIL